MGLLYYFLTLGLPLDMFLYFLAALWLFIHSDRTDTEKHHKRKSRLIIASALFGMTAVIAIAPYLFYVTELNDLFILLLFGALGGLFFGLPPAAVGAFFVAFIQFCKTDKADTRNAKKWKRVMLITGCAGVFFVLVFVAVCAISLMSIPQM